MKRGLGWAVLFLAWLSGCGGRDFALAPQVQQRRELTHPDAPHAAHVSEPALALAPESTVHLAWIRSDETGRSVRTTRLAEGEPRLLRVDSEERPVAGGHQAPGLAVGAGGRVHVSWSSPGKAPIKIPSQSLSLDDPGTSAFASDLVLATSTDGGRHFGAPLRIHEDRAGSRGFEAIAVDAQGAVLAAWIEAGAGPGAATRTVRIAEGVAGEIASLGERTCPCCRVALATDASGRVGALWRDEFPGQVRDMVFALSRDGGRRFAPSERVRDDGWSLDACPHRGGALALGPDGRALVAWYSEGRSGEPSLQLAAGDEDGFDAPRALHEGVGSFPDRVALALGRDGTGIVLWERRTSVRSEIAARAVLAGGRGLGPPRVLSRGIHASGPALVASPAGGFVAAWNEEEFPALRTVVATLALVEAPR